ncbi:MAG: hypothetical protein IPM29_21775 [Planctomycetes bacterium]|nr:hypothetical protein [Planctomycetota bacterium]
MRITLLTVLCVAALAAAGLAQDRWARQEERISSSAAKRLQTFAQIAERNRVFSRAKEAYELILAHYDPENARARRALGWQKVQGEWKEPDVEKEWPDDANDEQRFEVLGEWKRFAEDIAGLHRDLGVQMKDDAPARSLYHLQMALYYNPFDEAAHQAIGHERLPLNWGDGRVEAFWGTPEEVAFVKRLRDIEEYAASLSQKEYEIEPVAELPPQLARMTAEDADVSFHGARSANFLIFTRGTQENADDCVKWAERACDFLEYVLPDADKKRVDMRRHMRGTRKWIGFLWTTAEQKMFIRLNPEVAGTENWANISWAEDGKICEVARALTPIAMHDGLIARVFKSLGGNDATNEGLMHAATWYMRGTAITRYGAESTATTTGARKELPDSANWWLREMRDQAIARIDFPANGLPRVQLSDFRNAARLKTWSFGVFLLARFPQKWLGYLHGLPESDKRPFPNLIDEFFEKHFGAKLADVEDEWRGWAAGRTLAAYATGYGPPLLPEKPNKDQIKGLERLNEFRELIGLPPCEIDLESTIACRAHALFLQQNPDHWVWPEAHEEDPAKPGFTTRGMRAGLNSVIVIAQDPKDHIDPADSLDGWIGTVYHRFPLLRPNIRRIGFAAEGNIVVLDMGSLEKPRIIGGEEGGEEPRKWVLWPADGMENVPTQFHAQEHPDPLADTEEGRAAEPFALQRRAGYPVSLQMERFVANQVEDARLTIVRLKKRGQEWIEDGVIPCWVHTPRAPLLKRMEDPSVVFGIPKEPLDRDTRFRVIVTLKTLLGEQEVRWEFTTGKAPRGHGRLKMPGEK